MNCTQHNTTHSKKVNIYFHNSACWFHQNWLTDVAMLFVDFSKLKMRLDEFWPLALCFFLVSIHQNLASSLGWNRILPDNLVAHRVTIFQNPLARTGPNEAKSVLGPSSQRYCWALDSKIMLMLVFIWLFPNWNIVSIHSGQGRYFWE